MNRKSKYYIQKILLPFNVSRTKEIVKVNPTRVPQREEAKEIKIYVFDYNSETVEERRLNHITECYPYLNDDKLTWINVDGIRKSDVEALCNYYGVHPLIQEDIQSVGQRPKMEEIENVLFCICNMLFYNERLYKVEHEQISIVLGKNFVLSFQEEADKDVFNPIRDKLKIAASKLRQSGPDYLCYALLDMIVDNYFLVMEKLGERIENIEEEIQNSANSSALAKINLLRKEMIILKRSVAPVREVINGFIRTDSDLIEERTLKYFKDIYDHIIQANDLSENYRDITMNLQDLYLNNVNLRMNEVMKVMAIVTCLLAPATVIGGIFGMNFDKIPWLHSDGGFYSAVGIMLIIPIWMLMMFRRKGWF
jgi:magnesium transporter